MNEAPLADGDSLPTMSLLWTKVAALEVLCLEVNLPEKAYLDVSLSTKAD